MADRITEFVIQKIQKSGTLGLDKGAIFNQDQVMSRHQFKATLDIIGINPFVFVPQPILLLLFRSAGKDKGFIPIRGTVNGVPYEQTLVRYSGEWRLYINTTMLPESPKRIGETIDVSIEFDPRDRTLLPHPDLTTALAQNKQAEANFNSYPLLTEKK